MPAQIIAFPRPPVARAIPISAVPAERKAPPSAHELAHDTLRDLFMAARSGHAASLGALKMIGQSHGNCEIARLAGMLVAELERETVSLPCDCEMGDLA